MHSTQIILELIFSSFMTTFLDPFGSIQMVAAGTTKISEKSVIQTQFGYNITVDLSITVLEPNDPNGKIAFPPPVTSKVTTRKPPLTSVSVATVYPTSNISASTSTSSAVETSILSTKVVGITTQNVTNKTDENSQGTKTSSTPSKPTNATLTPTSTTYTTTAATDSPTIATGSTGATAVVTTATTAATPPITSDSVSATGGTTSKPDNALKALNDLLSNTADPSKLTSQKVTEYTDILLGLYNATLQNTSYASMAMNIMGNLGRVNISVSEEAEKNNQSNARLRRFIDDYTAEVDLNLEGEIEVNSTNMQIKAISLNKLSELNDNETIEFEPFTLDSNNTVTYLNVSIKLPRSILNGTENDTSSTRIQFIGYERSQLFVPKTGFELKEAPPDKQRVISATVKGRELTNLTDPIIIEFPKIEPDQNHTCVFWDEENSNWTTEGVTIEVDDESGFVNCKSTHLTSFAVLMDVSPDFQTSDTHGEVLTYLTYIGCAISMACLTITIITYGLFKCLYNEKSGKILLHLCSALLILNIMFLVATVDVSDYSDEACLAVGILLHYFLLAALMWMLMEALEMYQALVTVFTKYEGYYLLKRCLAAWGIPAVIVGITAAVDQHSYYQGQSNGEVCFLNSQNPIPYYVTLVTPSCIIIIINTVVFVMVARVILRPKFQQQLKNDNSPVTPAQIRGAFTVMFLMGVTWVFGPLAINELKTVFNYLFCICNSLQGCVIFIFRCLFNPEAKLAWLQLFQTGTLKRRRGPIISVYSDSYSKGGGDHRRPSNGNTSGYIGSGTTRTTSTSKSGGSGGGFHPHPHQLHTTNGWHPNLNGMRRDHGPMVESSVSYGAHDYRSTPEKSRRISAEYTSTTTKRESLPNESMPNYRYQDQLTQF